MIYNISVKILGEGVSVYGPSYNPPPEFTYEPSVYMSVLHDDLKASSTRNCTKLQEVSMTNAK